MLPDAWNPLVLGALVLVALMALRHLVQGLVILGLVLAVAVYLGLITPDHLLGNLAAPFTGNLLEQIGGVLRKFLEHS